METFDQRYDRQLELEKQAVELSYDKLMKNIRSRIKADQADELAEGRIILLHSIDLVTAKIKEFFGTRSRGFHGAVKKYISDFELGICHLSYTGSFGIT